MRDASSSKEEHQGRSNTACAANVPHAPEDGGENGFHASSLPETERGVEVFCAFMISPFLSCLHHRKSMFLSIGILEEQHPQPTIE